MQIKFMFFNIKIKKTISQELFFAGSSYRTPFINSNRNNQKSSVKETTFTQFLTDKNILHQTTPICSPQSNGKIERFHQNYNKLFVFDEKILAAVGLQNKLNDYYYFYNFERVHKSLNFQTLF